MKKSGVMLSIICVVVFAVFVYGQLRMLEKDGADALKGEMEKTVITVLAGQSTSDAGVEDMIDEMAAEKFPDVELEWECVDWGENFAPQMRGRLAAGDTPDLIIGKVQDVRTYAGSGNLAPLQVAGMERIEKEVRDIVTIDGKAYGLPYNAWYQGVFYNKDIFEKCGVSVPETMQELRQAVQVFEQNGITPFAAHFQENWKIANMTMQFMINDIFRKQPQWGRDFVDGKVSFLGNEQVTDCLEQNRFIAEHTWQDALTIEQYESDRRFAEGEAAMYLTGSWSLQNAWAYDSSVRYGIFPYPNVTSDASLIKETNMTFMISSVCEHQEMLNRILEELLQNEKVMREILGFTQTYPVVTDIEMSYGNSVEEDIEKYITENRIVDAFVGNSQLQWEFQDELADGTGKWLRGETDIKEVLKKADKNRKESSGAISK